MTPHCCVLAVEEQGGEAKVLPARSPEADVTITWQGSVPEVDSNMERAIKLLPPGSKPADVTLSGEYRFDDISA